MHEMILSKITLEMSKNRLKTQLYSSKNKVSGIPTWKISPYRSDKINENNHLQDILTRFSSRQDRFTVAA